MKISLVNGEGLPFIGIALAIFIITMVIGSVFLILPFGLLLAFVIYFFRDPERIVPEGSDMVVSPADGKIINISNEPDNIKKISIFMSVFNVHVNRIPLDGIVRKIEYNKGKFLVASWDKASLLNEQNAITVEDQHGRVVKFVQIAGWVARRIVCHLRERMAVKKGERFGMIRFGSRLDVYLPPTFQLSVKLGDRVVAGVSVLGRF